MIRIALALLGLLVSASAARAQIVAGTLLETDTREPLRGGVVTMLSRDSAELARVHTDSAGEFRFTLPRGGAFRLKAEHAGFRAATSPTLSIGAHDTLQVEFSLARNVVVLEPLVVKARSRRLTPAARRFYDRARNSIAGNFITREQIDRAHPIRTTDLLHRLPGIQTSPMMGGNAVTVRGTCRPTVHVDGVRVNNYRSIDDLVQPLDLEGVEVYRSAHEAPAEYTGLRAGCAVILLWTRIE